MKTLEVYFKNKDRGLTITTALRIEDIVCIDMGCVSHMNQFSEVE